MERSAMQQLVAWKDKPNRKPLLVKGARQVGKTYLIKQFATRNFKNMVYINGEEEPRVKGLFVEDYDIKRIIRALEIISGQSIVPGDTCIVLDEIQEVPRGLASLKYFCENAPQYHVVVVGSLMGIALHQGTSFPVGKVDIVDIYPMTFKEYLLANDKKQLQDILADKDWATVNLLKMTYVDLLRQYYFTGGMPEAVAAYLQTKDTEEVRRIQNNILMAYENDISKHAPDREIARIRMVWNAIPSQLAKENKKFVYGLLKAGARAKEFETAIEWLKDYGIVYKISRIKSPVIPLAMYEDFSSFKLFVLDCGLFGAMCSTPPRQMLIGDNIFEMSKGAFTEQFVLQQLIAMPDTPVYYWSNNNSSAELDFVIQQKERIIPIEVKAEENLKAKSLRTFVEKHKTLKGLRLSMSGYRDQEWMENRPLFSIGVAGM